MVMGNMEPGTKILDLGGQPHIWDSITVPLNITIVNLPGVVIEPYNSLHKIEYIEGDACDLGAIDDNEFDISFSNSVIEHVGDRSKIKRFAYESRRVARRYWIQTPSKYFPIEPHTGMFFWWFYPSFAKRYFISRWEQKMPLLAQHVDRTTYITKQELSSLYPNSQIFTERFCGFAKSYSVYLSNLN